MRLLKIGNTWRRCSYFEWMKEIDAKRRDILVKVENLKADVTLYLLKRTS